VVTSGCRDKGASPHGVTTTGGHGEQGDMWDQVTIPGSQKWKRATDRWARPSNKIPPNFQTPFKLANSKRKPSIAPKIFKL
jgi:hypothetical protein